MAPTGKEGFVTDGYCNCNQCTESNTTVVANAATGDLMCPKETILIYRGCNTLNRV